MIETTCGICGGDGRIANAFGSTTTCPSCHGSGRRSDEGGLRDVTKTKPSHYRQPAKGTVAEKEAGPSTYEGGQLAKEVQASACVSNETKAKLTREIIDYEAIHGKVTQTFIKKVRRQIRPPPA
jgi:DnaJ-class molecular chaperone